MLHRFENREGYCIQLKGQGGIQQAEHNYLGSEHLSHGWISSYWCEKKLPDLHDHTSSSHCSRFHRSPSTGLMVAVNRMERSRAGGQEALCSAISCRAIQLLQGSLKQLTAVSNNWASPSAETQAMTTWLLLDHVAGDWRTVGPKEQQLSMAATWICERGPSPQTHRFCEVGSSQIPPP